MHISVKVTSYSRSGLLTDSRFAICLLAVNHLQHPRSILIVLSCLLKDTCRAAGDLHPVHGPSWGGARGPPAFLSQLSHWEQVVFMESMWPTLFSSECLCWLPHYPQCIASVMLKSCLVFLKAMRLGMCLTEKISALVPFHAGMSCNVVGFESNVSEWTIY